MPRRPRPAAAAGSARGRGRPGRCTPWLPVSTWNRISSCCTPGSPPSIRTSSGAASTVAPVDGSRSTNSSSTPSVIAPAARTAPGSAAGHRRGPSCPARSGRYHDHLLPASCSGSGHSGSRWPSALARPAIARAAGISGHSSAASVMEAAACTATASAPASVTTCPAACPGCLQRLPGRDRQGLGHCLVLSVLRTRRESPAVRLSPMVPKGQARMRTADRRTQEHPPRGEARAGALSWLVTRAARRCARRRHLAGHGGGSPVGGLGEQGSPDPERLLPEALPGGGDERPAVREECPPGGIEIVKRQAGSIRAAVGEVIGG